MNSDKTSCPLDCYDGCSIIYERKLKGDSNHPVTKGFLCYKMNRFFDYKRIESAMFEGENIPLEKALEILEEKLKEYKDGKNLFFKGSGNLGYMQNITKEFFAKFGFYGTEGSLCDGAGDAGITQGRGANLLIPPSQISKSEVVVVWGRNPEVTNTHILPFIKGKKLIVIDPYATNLSKKADLFLQIKPRGDLFLALLLSRIIYMQELEDVDFIKNHCEDFDLFKELFEEHHLKRLSKLCDIEIDNAWKMVDMIVGKKTVFLVGIGVQKYTTGHYVLRAIDSLASMLGLFGKDGCGVSYLSDSSFGFKSAFPKFKKSVTLPNIDFSSFDMVFIQGANPLVSLPSTKKVEESLKKSKFVVYFGLYENDTSKMADLVIPAVDFLCKNDVKLSYGHEYISFMPKLKEDKKGISEYHLAKTLTKIFFNSDLKKEKEYIDQFVMQNSSEKDGELFSKTYEETPYKEGFYTPSKKFNFLDEYDDDFLEDYEDEEGYYLITRKHKKSLNSSFYNDEYIYIPKLLGFEEDEEILVTSEYAKESFKIKIDENLRKDTLCIYAGNKKANSLTPNFTSLEGNNAVYQELKVTIEKL